MPDKTDPPDEVPDLFRAELVALGHIARALESLPPPRRARAVLFAALSVAPHQLDNGTVAGLIEAAQQPELDEVTRRQYDEAMFRAIVGRDTDTTGWLPNNPRLQAWIDEARRRDAGDIAALLATVTEQLRRHADELGCGCDGGPTCPVVGPVEPMFAAADPLDLGSFSNRPSTPIDPRRALDDMRDRMERMKAGDVPANIHPLRLPPISPAMYDLLAEPVEQYKCPRCGCGDFVTTAISPASHVRVDMRCQGCGAEYCTRK